MYAGYLDRQYNRKETLESFTPLMNHVIDYNIWAVKPDSPFKTVKTSSTRRRRAPTPSRLRPTAPAATITLRSSRSKPRPARSS
jgi:tripartite-type tricarboxylate transporter receptor subunit TctC